MKTKQLYGFSHPSSLPGRRARRKADGPNVAAALLGAVCVVGVFGVLALLYNFG